MDNRQNWGPSGLPSPAPTPSESSLQVNMGTGSSRTRSTASTSEPSLLQQGTFLVYSSAQDARLAAAPADRLAPEDVLRDLITTDNSPGQARHGVKRQHEDNDNDDGDGNTNQDRGKRQAPAGRAGFGAQTAAGRDGLIEELELLSANTRLPLTAAAAAHHPGLPPSSPSALPAIARTPAATTPAVPPHHPAPPSFHHGPGFPTPANHHIPIIVVVQDTDARDSEANATHHQAPPSSSSSTTTSQSRHHTLPMRPTRERSSGRRRR
ncbi:hypothetical protein VTJ49DRAFT_4731 [Mycothermus thermophilus]|uniref:Uncharacterized protein n=1 Tax=Humicola insolens TaxID=85995 RepID=A0ABR3V5K0_HUMIN